MKKILSILSAIFCILVSTPVYSVSNFDASNTFVRHLSVSDGLSDDEIINFTKQDDGRLWVSTGAGFSIINNGFITSYSYFDMDGSRHFINKVLDIAVKDYALVATESNLLKFNPLDKSFEVLQYMGSNIIASAILRVDNLVYLYVPSLQSVLGFNMDTQDINVIVEFPKDSYFLFEKIVLSKSNGGVLIMSDGTKGVFEINPVTKAIRKIERLYNNPVPSSLFIDSYNILWSASKNGGLVGCLLSQDYSKYQEYSPGKDGIPQHMLVSMDEMPDSRDLVVTSNGGGAFVISRKSGKVSEYFDLGHSIFLTDVMVQSKDELFIGTARYGVVNVKNASILTNLLQQKVSAIFDGGKGYVYCVANPLGLVRYDERNNSYRKFPATENLAIQSMCSLDTNTLLLQVKGGILYEYDTETGVLERSSLPESNAECKIVDNNNGLVFILGPTGSSYRYNIATGQIDYFKLFHDNDASNRIICTQSIDNSSIIITTLNKIYELDQEDLWLRELLSSEKHIIWSQTDRNGTLWYLTIDGLMRFSITDNKEEELVVPSRSNLYYTSMAIEDTQLSRIYLTTSENHVLVYNPLDGEISIVGSEDCLLPNNSFSENTFSSSTGYVYLPGSNGLTIIPIENDELFLADYKCNVKCIASFINGKFADVGAGTINCANNSNILIDYVVDTSSPVNEISLGFRLVDRKGNIVKTGYPHSNTMDLGTLLAGNYSLQINKVLRNGRSDWEHILYINVLRTSVTDLVIVSFIGIALLLTIILLSVKLKKLKRYVYGRDKQLQQNIKMYQSNTSMVYDLFNKCIKEIKMPLSIIYNQVFKLLVHNANITESGPLDSSLRKIDRLATMLYAVEIGGNKVFVNISSFTLNRCIAAIVEDFRIECKIKNIQIIEKFDPTITIVNLDRSIVEIIFTILFFNIISNQKGGNIMVFTSVENSEIYKVSLVTSERVGNCNIEAIRKMFTDTNFSINSFGLGFYKANMLAKRIGNECIHVEENASGGLSFHIMLSSVQVNNNISEMIGYSYQDRLSRRYLIDERDIVTLPHSILLVDDNADLLEYMRDEYKNFFMDVFIAKDGKEALDIVRKEHPSVVVSDVMMPVMNGIELCKEIKTDLELSHTLVILRSVKDEISDVSYGYKTTADEFIPKPFDINALFYEIRRLLQNRYFDQNSVRIMLKEEDIKNSTYSIADEKFMLHFGRFVYGNLHNPSLNQSMIAAEMNLPESLIDKKIKALSGVYTDRFLSLVRVKFAKELLTGSKKMSIFDISTQLGFQDSDSFVTIFTQETGMTPQHYSQNPS